MKVAFYSTSAEDLFRYRLPVARRLRDAGYRVLFAGPGGEYAARTEQEGFPYRRLASSLEGLAALSDPVIGFRLGRIYRTDKPDIAHHFTLHGLVRGAIAARVAGVSWIVQSMPSLSMNTRSSRLFRPGGRRVLRAALRQSEVTFRTFEDRVLLLSMGCVRPEQTHIIASSGIDLAAYPFEDEPDRTPVVAAIGPMRDPEALEIFVEAARRLRANGAAGRFVLVAAHGRGPAVPRPKLDAWQEEGVIEWWGRRSDTAQILRAIHVAYVTEDYVGEIPLLLLEAAASGRPLVALDDPAVRACVRDDETGFTVPHHDVDALYAALERLLRDGDRRRRMGRNARRLVEREFSADLVAQETMAVYEQLFLKGRNV